MHSVPNCWTPICFCLLALLSFLVLLLPRCYSCFPATRRCHLPFMNIPSTFPGPMCFHHRDPSSYLPHWPPAAAGQADILPGGGDAGADHPGVSVAGCFCRGVRAGGGGAGQSNPGGWPFPWRLAGPGARVELWMPLAAVACWERMMYTILLPGINGKPHGCNRSMEQG